MKEITERGNTWEIVVVVDEFATVLTAESEDEAHATAARIIAGGLPRRGEDGGFTRIYPPHRICTVDIRPPKSRVIAPKPGLVARGTA